MGVTPQLAENGRDLTIRIDPPFRGLYSQNTPTDIPDGFQPDLLNMDVPAGVPEVMAGSALLATGMDIPGTTLTLFGAWYSAAGVPTYIGANAAGEVYYWTGSAWSYLRRGLSTSTTWWSQRKIGSNLVISNKNDGIWKYDGARLLPIGAKHIAGMESGETWSAGSADTTNVKQGTQSRKLTSTGALVQGFYSFAAIDLVDGIGPTARDYTTSDLIHFWVYIDTVANLDLTTSFVLLWTSVGNYYTGYASGWGTLANGWNEISVAKSTFTATGSPNWASIAQVGFGVDATAGNTVNCSFDDLYLRYAVNMPACRALGTFKNMLLGLNSTDDASEIVFSRVSAPDDWDQLAVIPVASGDGDSIVGGTAHFDQVIIGKEHSIHSLYCAVSNTEYPAYRWSQTPVTFAHGMASHRSLIEAEGNLYWWTTRDVVRYDGSTVQKISQMVDPTIAGMEPTRLPFIVGGRLREENQLWWAYTPSGGSTNTRVLRYDYVQGAWLPKTGETLPLLENVLVSGQDLLLSVNSSGQVLQQRSGTTWNGSSISATLDLPWMSGPGAERMVRWDELLLGFANGTGTVTINYRLADHPRQMASAAYAAAGTVSLSSSSEMGRLLLGFRSRWIQLQLANVSGNSFQLLPPTILKAVLLPQRY